MHSIIESHRDEVRRLCRRFGVLSLDVFGSATGDAFDPQRSDIDFVVDFGPGAQPDLFNRCFGLNEALAALFARKVDLVMAGSMVNLYFIDAVKRPALLQDVDTCIISPAMSDYSNARCARYRRRGGGDAQPIGCFFGIAGSRCRRPDHAAGQRGPGGCGVHHRDPRGALHAAEGRVRQVHASRRSRARP